MCETVSLWHLARLYLTIGIIGFGPAVVAEMKKRLINERNWLSEDDFLNGMALSQMLPGATFVSLTVYGGYKIRGIAGAIVSFFSFLLPSFSVMVFFSYLYFVYGSLPSVSLLFQGVTVVVVGLVAEALLVLAKTAVTDYQGGLIAVAAAGIMFIYPSIFLLLFLAATAGILLYYPSLKNQNIPQAAASADNGREVTAGNGYFMVIVFLTIMFLMYEPPMLQKVSWVFFKMGFCLFGGGFSMLPFIQQEVVESYHWLTADEFLVGIALGQVTPGPITIMAAFVGYKVAAVTGAIAATLGIYLPSLFLVIVTTKAHQIIRHNIWVKAAIKGMVSAFAGMMFFVVSGMAHHALHDLLSIFFAIGIFIVLHFAKLSAIWVVPGGTLLYWFIHSISL